MAVMREDPGQQPYSGEDRRRAALIGPAPLGVEFILVTLCLVGCYVLLLVGPSLAPAIGIVNPELFGALLDAAGFALAMLFGALCFVRWRASGETAPLWLGAGVLLYGICTVAIHDLLPLLLQTGPIDALRWTYPASRVVVLGLFLVAVRSPEIDTRVGPGRVAGIALGSTTALAILLAAVPWLTGLLAGAADPLPVARNAISPYLVATAWFIVAVALIWRGVSKHAPVFGWVGLAIAGLGFAELSSVAGADPASLWAASSSLLRIGSLLCAAIVALRELQHLFATQSDLLHRSVATHLATEWRLLAESNAAEERAHEARNALSAIEGATRTLEHYRDQLDEDQRAQLSSAVAAEVARLQQLVSSAVLPQRPSDRVRPAEAIAALITLARSDGAHVTVDVPHDLRVHADAADVAEIVQNLLANARRYAPASDIVVRAARDGLGVTLRVEDRGPGIRPEERELIFTRGRRGAASARVPGSGLGLYVSERLARSHGGRLWVDAREGGGASFALWLPAAAGQPDTVSQETLKERQEGRQIRGRGQHLVALPAVDDAIPGAVRGLGQLDDDVRGETGG